MDLIKNVGRSSEKVPEFDKHLKKAGGHIGRNVVEIINLGKGMNLFPSFQQIAQSVGDVDDSFMFESLKEFKGSHFLGQILV